MNENVQNDGGRAMAEREAAAVAPLTQAGGSTSMRQLTGHQVNPANERLAIHVADEPGSGGASHRYIVTLDGGILNDIRFQNGPIQEAGVNGVTHEALLAIVVDRLQSFQKGPYSCRENALALTKLEEAQHWLLHRTRARIERGVEGTHEK